jgi:hypothetical protein
LTVNIEFYFCYFWLFSRKLQGVARVSIPGATAKDVKENGKTLGNDIKMIGTEMINSVTYVVLGVGAGEYQFSSSWTGLST